MQSARHWAGRGDGEGEEGEVVITLAGVSTRWDLFVERRAIEFEHRCFHTSHSLGCKCAFCPCWLLYGTVCSVFLKVDLPEFGTKMVLQVVPARACVHVCVCARECVRGVNKSKKRAAEFA